MKNTIDKNLTKHKIMIETVVASIVLFCLYKLIISGIELSENDVLEYLFANIERICILAVFSLIEIILIMAQYYKAKTDKNLFKELKLNKDKNLFDLLKISKSQKNRKYEANLQAKEHAEGIVFGKNERNHFICSSEEEEGHILVIGGSGSGKTAAILIPTLKVWYGNAFVLDISGDISANANRRDALHFAPLENESIAYNVFYEVDLEEDENEKLEKLCQLAYMIMPDDINIGENGRFFNEEGRNILIASLIHYYEEGLDFVEICEKIVYTPTTNLLNELITNRKAKAYITSFLGTNEKNTAGCKQAMDAKLKFFATNSNIKKYVHRSLSGEKVITPLALEDNSVFLRIPDKNLEVYAPIIRIIISQFLQYLSARPDTKTKPILMCIDEFASFGKMAIINPLRKLRKRKVRIMILTQSLSDIDGIYGINDRRVICDNCDYKVILKATDAETQEYFSKLVGEEEVEKYSITWNGQDTRRSYTKTTVTKRIIESAQLAYLENRLLLLSPKGYKILNKNFYFLADGQRKRIRNRK